MNTIAVPDKWLGVELRHLAALDAVARAGSFGRAAEALGYTQSAISQQIATLERIVGERLVERPGGPRRVSLTEAGELLRRHAEAIVARFDAAQADMAALHAGETGSLRIRTFQSVGARVLPAVMRRFLADWPRIEISLSEAATDDELYAGIENGTVDLAFGSPPLPDGPFEGQNLMSDAWVLVVPSDGSLARKRHADLGDLGDVRLLGSNTCLSGLAAEAVLAEHNIDVDYAFRSDDNGTLQGMAAAGFGVALMPLLAVSPGDARVKVLKLKPEIPRRQILVVWHRDRHRSPAARAFVDLAVEVGAEVERELSEP